MTPQSRQILSNARSLIADPEKWTEITEATNADYMPVDAASDEAARWDAWGAIQRATSDLLQTKHFPTYHKPAWDAAVSLSNNIAEHGITALHGVTDEGHAAVLDLFDRALEREAQP
jgi:hypothetical protein